MHPISPTEINRAGRRFGVSLALVLMTLAAFTIPGWNAALELSRAGLADGDYWRLVTGHFTHWTADHLLWDLLTFAGLSVFCESRSRLRFLLCLGLTSAAISAGFLLFEADLSSYRGLSGLDSALFALAMTELLRRPQLRAVAFLGLSGFLAKTLFEISTGSSVFVADAATFQSVPGAHLIGFLCGACCALTPAGQRPAHRESATRPRPDRPADANRRSPSAAAR